MCSNGGVTLRIDSTLPEGFEILERVTFDPRPALTALRALRLPAGAGYAWCAGEASAMAATRQILLAEKEHPREDMKVAAYWKHGASDFHENLGP